MEEGKDSLERLLKDMDAAAMGGHLDAQKCEGCLAMEDAMACVRCAFGDAARRMRALMPHDADGREIEVGDTIESTFGTQVHVTGVVALPVNAHDGVVDQFPVSLLHLWRVVESDSWEKLEADATMTPREYLTRRGGSDEPYGYEAICEMATDLVRRAKALAKAGEGE